MWGSEVNAAVVTLHAWHSRSFPLLTWMAADKRNETVSPRATSTALRCGDGHAKHLVQRRCHCGGRRFYFHLWATLGALTSTTQHTIASQQWTRNTRRTKNTENWFDTAVMNAVDDNITLPVLQKRSATQAPVVSPPQVVTSVAHSLRPTPRPMK